MIFADLDAAAADPSRSGRGVAASPRPHLAHEVHCPARRVPRRRHLPLRARATSSRGAAAADAHVGRRRRRRRLPAHADRGGARAPRSPSSTATPRPTLGRALSDAVIEIVRGRRRRTCGTSAHPGLGERRDAPRRAARRGGPRRRPQDPRDRCSARTWRGARPRRSWPGDGGFSEMLGVYFGDGDAALRPPLDPGSRGARTHERPPLQGRAAATTSRAIYSGLGASCVRTRRRLHAIQTNRNILLSEHAKADSIPNLEILANDPCAAATPPASGPWTRTRSSTSRAAASPRPRPSGSIVFGFFHEVLDRVRIPEVRESVEAAIARELGGGASADDPHEGVQRGRRPRRRGAPIRSGARASSRSSTSATDGFRAVDAICSHEHYYLYEGEVDVEDHTIECPKHGSTFDLETRERRARSRPMRPVAVYAVKVDDDDVLIEVDADETETRERRRDPGDSRPRTRTWRASGS